MNQRAALLHAPLAAQSVEGVGRLPGHAEALARLMAERERMPFQWAVHDCCLWASDAVLAQVGVDPAATLRGRYSNAMQASRVLAVLGGLEGVARSALGEPLQSPMLACAGDVGLTHGEEDGQALGVCIGAWWAVASRDGLSLRPLSAASVAWRVGCA